ncbi:MAG: thioredoxin domain-containing protein [Anaerolineaceae bacterium]
MSNHLTDSTSPYLLQHAQNPVDWYPWGQEALEKARIEDKPIFLSIGYSACHWCHVMAHESFEDPEVAALMNRYFINIKVDREERPDLDSIYMSAVVALTGQGGWPMSVFLTPALVPFYGGTYFPPQPRYGMPAFKDVLNTFALMWRDNRTQITQAGEEIISLLSKNAERVGSTGVFTEELLSKAASKLFARYDWAHGGWGSAPKFPQPMSLEFLLRRHVSGEAGALDVVVHALKAMVQGGMYDVLAGGFSRYSTDNDWLTPHFEKMLYDNAQLARVYLHAWQITNDPMFRRVVEETLDFVKRELRDPQGGFYSSLDADTEGIEGKFYVWTLDEIKKAFGKSDDLFEAAYGIDASGNWEGNIILRRASSDSDLAMQFQMSIADVHSRLVERQAQLLAERKSRIRPGTDTKVLTFWNGLMLSTFAEAARVLDNEEYLQIAQRNADFLLSSLPVDGKLRRAWRNGRVSNEVFLEDYAALILGLIELYQTDFDNRWYAEAYKLTEEMINQFADPSGGFFDTTSDAELVIQRPQELQDNATPSGNALAAEALLKMAAYSEKALWQQLAEKTLSLVAEVSSEYPLAFGRWLAALDFHLNQTTQIAIIGDPRDNDAKAFLAEINKNFRPNTIVAASTIPVAAGSPTLLLDRPMVNAKTTAYVCEGFVCRQPVIKLEDFIKLIR